MMTKVLQGSMLTALLGVLYFYPSRPLLLLIMLLCVGYDYDFSSGKSIWK